MDATRDDLLVDHAIAQIGIMSFVFHLLKDYTPCSKIFPKLIPLTRHEWDV